MALALALERRSTKPHPVCQPRVPTFGDLERRRRELGVPLAAMLLAAGIHPETWWLGRAGRVATRPATILKLAAALDRLAENKARRAAPGLIAAFVRAAEEIIRQKVNSPELVIACNPNRAPRKTPARSLPARRVRMFAIYLATVELELANADVARAINCKRQNVHQLRDAVERLRDNHRVDQLLTELGGMLRGAE